MKTFLASLRASLATVRSASRVAAALEVGAAPARADLLKLGMDPAGFARVRLA